MTGPRWTAGILALALALPSCRERDPPTPDRSQSAPHTAGAEADGEWTPGLPEDPAFLADFLPTNGSDVSRTGRSAEDALAAKGEPVLPVLERYLRPGIQFRELDELLKVHGSRRGAVVRVLARIPGDGSTDLLVRCLADPPDDFGMKAALLHAVVTRTLADPQIAALVGNADFDIALAGIPLAKDARDDSQSKRALRRVFGPATARKQFFNRFGEEPRDSDRLWAVRDAAGRALAVDMSSEYRERAARHVVELRDAATLHPSDQGEFVGFSGLTNEEFRIMYPIQHMAALGDPAHELVLAARSGAEGDFAEVVDMALARLGDGDRIPAVAAVMTDSPRPALRVCAAMILGRTKDRSIIASYWRALRDPLSRPRGGCLWPDELVYPVRTTAAEALIDLGEDPARVRAAAK